MTVTRIALIGIAGFLCSFNQQPVKTDMLVPDEATAQKVAEAIWLPIYGPSIYEKKPFKAVLTDGYWYVTGSMPKPSYEVNAKGDSILHIYAGGVPYIHISARNGEVVAVGHGK